MKKEQDTTAAWLHRGASRVFVKKFFYDFILYFWFGGMVAYAAIFRIMDYSFEDSFGTAVVILTPSAPTAWIVGYYLLGIKYRVSRSQKYQELFLQNAIDAPEKYRKEHALRKDIKVFLYEKDHPLHYYAIRKTREFEENLAKLFREKEEVIDFLVSVKGQNVI